MAQGYRVPGITSWALLDTATDPDDTTVIAAPGVALKILIRRAVICVATEKAGVSVVLEDGVGGNMVAAADGSTPGTTQADFGQAGRLLSANTALNATIEGATGVVASVWVEYDEVS